MRALIFIWPTAFSLSACGEKDEEKASQNRPAIPGY